MKSAKLTIFFSILLVLSLGFSVPTAADTGAGVRVSLLQNQIISGADVKLGFEVANLNPANSSSISEINVSLPANFTAFDNLTFPSISVSPGETKQFSLNIKAPVLSADASYTVEFVVLFSDGSLSKRKETLTILADKIAPASTLANVKDSSYFSSAPISFQFEASDSAPSSGLAALVITANDETARVVSASGKFSFDFKPPGDGTYNVTYYAVDNAGNEEAQKSVTIFYDKTPPVVEIKNLAPIMNNPTPQISFIFTDNIASSANCVVTVSNHKETVLANSGAQSSVTLPKLADGTYTVQASCTDSAGNTGSSALTQFTIDTKPPTIINITPSDGAFLAENQSITIQFDKQVSVDQLRKMLFLLEGDKALALDVSTNDGKTFVVTPPKIEKGKEYKLVVDKNLSDTAGNNLNSTYSFDFKGGRSPSGLLALTLGKTGRSAMLGLLIVIGLAFVFYSRREK